MERYEITELNGVIDKTGKLLWGIIKNVKDPAGNDAHFSRMTIDEKNKYIACRTDNDDLNRVLKELADLIQFTDISDHRGPEMEIGGIVSCLN